MFINKALKLNRFRSVYIPSNREYFSRYGTSLPQGEGSYSGDEYIPSMRSKIDSLEDMSHEEFSRIRQEELEAIRARQNNNPDPGNHD